MCLCVCHGLAAIVEDIRANYRLMTRTASITRLQSLQPPRLLSVRKQTQRPTVVDALPCFRHTAFMRQDGRRDVATLRPMREESDTCLNEAWIIIMYNECFIFFVWCWLLTSFCPHTCITLFCRASEYQINELGLNP